MCLKVILPEQKRLDDPTGKADIDFKMVIQQIEQNIMELKKMLSEREG